MNEDRLPLHDAAFVAAALDRLAFASVEVDETGCLAWTRPLRDDGYGQVSYHVGGRMVNVRAHRLAYRLLVGPIPEGLDLDHLCRHRWCINEAHLEPVTRRENLLRSERTVAGQNAARATCHRGHPLDGVTTVRRTGRTQRYCRTCKRAGRSPADARSLPASEFRQFAQQGDVVDEVGLEEPHKPLGFGHSVLQG